MSELRKVSGPPSRIDRNIGRILVLVVVAVSVAIVKPWGAGTSGDAGSVFPGPTPSPSPSPSPTANPLPKQYDVQAFGVREPPPTWEIWSAGSLASFSYAMRIDLNGPNSSGDPPRASTSPVTSPAAIGRGPTEAVEDVPADWPTVLVPRGNRLELVALNRPVGFTVEVVELVKVESDGTQTPMHAIVGASPWPAHFTIIGLGSDADPTSMRAWPTGQYRIVLRIGPATTTRTIQVAIDPGGEDPAAPRPSSSPSTPTP